MSFEFDARQRGAGLDFSDLIDASETGLITTAAQPGRRNRRRLAKQRLTQASMLAPLMALEGCFTIAGKAPSLKDDSTKTPATDGPASAPGGSPVVPAAIDAEDDSNFSTGVDDAVHIAINDLLENDAAPDGVSLELVRVFGAQHGTVMIHDGMVMFTPDAGYEGLASFKYEVRGSNGKLSEATVQVEVSEHTDSSHGGGDHNMGGGDSGHVHPDDPSKASEHMAMMALVPVEDATHVAVNSGSWFDPNTWEGGEVPGAGAKVVIPEGIEVAYDGESAVSLFTVRVDGALDFATDTDTFMEVDTLVVTPSGRLTIGTIDHPVDSNVQTVIQIADNGPIDVSWDPQLLSRGVLSHGQIEIHGAEKAAFLKVAIDPMAGDTSLTLDGDAQGWQVGDRLVLTGTHLTPTENVDPTEARNDQTEDEELVITRIEGNVIYFDTPLAFDHEAPRDDLKAYVANYTRNIRFETENAADLPVYQRGHVMLMHSDNIDVRYAEFSDLGRTDKSERAFDVADLDHVEYDSNVKARYALHLHRVGVDDPTDPAYLVGNSVWGSPGWGFVQHDSNAILADNAAYDVYGAAFVAETGNEIGRWSHNIAIKSIGNGGGAKWHEDVEAFDLGRTGAGFWFQGRLVDAVDNVAAGVPGGHGFVYMTRGNSMINIDPATADWSESLRYLSEVAPNIPAISQFDGNEAFAVQVGVEVIKANSEQGHDVRSVLENFTAWEVSSGMHMQYTAHYTIRNVDLIATDGSSGATAWHGIEYGPNAVNMVVNGANIEGFPVGVYLVKESNNMNHPFDGDWNYVFVDVDVSGATQDYFNSDGGDAFLTGDQLVPGRLLFDSDIDNIPVTPTPESRGYIDLTGERTDNIGVDQVSPTWDPIRHNYFTIQGAIRDEGYWTLPDGRKVTVIDQYYADRATGAVDKVAVLVEWERNFSDFPTEPHYNGVLDLNSDVPVARTDYATVSENGYVDIDVLANDYDPDGDEIDIDGLCPPSHGLISVNDDGTVRYTPDPNFTGNDAFMYWIEDEHGNFDKGMVQVTIEL